MFDGTSTLRLGLLAYRLLVTISQRPYFGAHYPVSSIRKTGGLVNVMSIVAVLNGGWVDHHCRKVYNDVFEISPDGRTTIFNRTPNSADIEVSPQPLNVLPYLKPARDLIALVY